MKAFGDIRRGLKDKECLSGISKLHGVVLFNIVDLELDLPSVSGVTSPQRAEELTFFSVGLSRENLPNLTWNGEQARDPRVFCQRPPILQK